MDWLLSIDRALFRLVNLQLSNPFFDWLMPFLASPRFFIPVALLAGLFICIYGGARGRLFIAFLVLAILIGDSLVINTLKHAIARPRPIHTLPEVNLLVGRGQSFSMPSSHVSSWFAAGFIALVFYRRTWLFFLPFACLMGFSRVYLGAHYPSDALVGAVLGAGYAAAVVWTCQWLWERAGPRRMPGWFQAIPDLLDPPARGQLATTSTSSTAQPVNWKLLGYLLILIVLAARLSYLASGKIELSEDEAYQWVWSKHLALSYYSKPPMIAYAQFLGTSIWGDTEFGVRFWPPVLSALVSFFLLRFVGRTVNPRSGFLVVLVCLATPLLAAGSILMTIDPLLVTFWCAAIITGWRAVQSDGKTRDWLWVGLWTGLAFLSKYSGLFLLICWGLYFVLWPPARVQLRRAGPYLAILIALLSTIPVLIWNAQNGWITVSHVASNAQLDRQWKPTLRFFWDFLLVEAGLLNPIFFVAMLWALVAIWRRRPWRPFEIYLFAMGAPVFLGYTVYTLHSRVLPNWIAPSVVPLLTLMVIYWEQRWRDGSVAVKRWFVAGLSLGLLAVVLLHDPNLIRKATGFNLTQDPLRRVHGWRQTASVVEKKRQALAADGKEIFVIGSHYGITGELTFYTPTAGARVKTQPLVYYLESDRPKNQFYFWPKYRYRKDRQGQDALFVDDATKDDPPPKEIFRQFERVEDLGIREIKERGRLLRRIRLYHCRNLR